MRMMKPGLWAGTNQKEHSLEFSIKWVFGLNLEVQSGVLSMKATKYNLPKKK